MVKGVGRALGKGGRRLAGKGVRKESAEEKRARRVRGGGRKR